MPPFEYSGDDGQQWFALFVRTKYERTIGCNLTGKGYETYVPCHNVARTWADRIKITQVPLFPNYVFCRFDPKNRFPILTTPEVYSIVGPTPIPVDELNAVQRMVEYGVSLSSAPALYEGETVRVIAGPLKGLDGTVVKLKNSWRLVISVALLQRGVAVEINRDDVVKLGHEPQAGWNEYPAQRRQQ
jgi:transcription antitermination factor NusG